MTSTFLALSLVLLAPAATPDTQRKPNPLAPSLPQLTDKEEEELDRIIDRFILFDLGKLGGEEGKRALADFQKLGPEATFALIRGFNRAAAIEGSCPAVTIAKKLLSIIKSTNDLALLDFLRENIGAGVLRTPHGGVMKDLRVAAMLRRHQAVRGVPATPLADSGDDGKIVIRPRSPAEKAMKSASTAELAKIAETAKAGRLKDVLTELATRSGPESIRALGRAATTDNDSEIRYFAIDLLAKNLARQPLETLKEKLKDDQPEVRAAAAKVVGERRLKYVDDLITLLNDKDGEVRQAARLALKQLSGNEVDFGPDFITTDEERTEAIQKWRDWWSKRASK